MNISNYFIFNLQIQRFEEVFNQFKYPDVVIREELAQEMELKDETIRVSPSRSALPDCHCLIPISPVRQFYQFFSTTNSW